MANASPPCASEVTLTLAPDSIKGTLGIVVDEGANAMPRRTSPAAAVRKVVKDSFAGSVVAARLSVMVTSLLGSAPWSPLVLTAEVTAYIVTVPSLFTLPVMLRRPPVAGLIAVG